MTLSDHMLAFIAMAIFISTILTVGTLIAADIIPVGRRRAERRTPDADSPRSQEA